MEILGGHSKSCNQNAIVTIFYTDGMSGAGFVPADAVDAAKKLTESIAGESDESHSTDFARKRIVRCQGKGKQRAAHYDDDERRRPCPFERRITASSTRRQQPRLYLNLSLHTYDETRYVLHFLRNSKRDFSHCF